MDDLISRQDVIDFLQITRDSEYKKSISAEVKHKSVIRSKHDAHVAFCDYLIECVKQLPTHPTPSNPLGALDCVDRQAAIDALMALKEAHKADRFTGDFLHWTGIKAMLENLPSAQPETAKRIVGKSRDGMTLWYQCDMCNEPVDMQDNYCRGCGRRLIDE